MSNAVSRILIPTTWGPITVDAADGAVVGCTMAGVDDSVKRKPLKLFRSRVTVKGAAGDLKILNEADAFIRAIMSGKRGKPPRVNIPAGTDFQRNVWKNLVKMRAGQTMSYGEMARKAGSPDASRAAGQACGANKIPLFIPCHRVITASGTLGGFSCGLPWKEHLLRVESGSSKRPA